jgi:DNA-directed RNA polymerase subunit alpha
MSIFINFEEAAEAAEAGAEGIEPRLGEVLGRSVEELELSVRSYNCLKNANIQTIGDLVQKTEAEMLRTKNFGRKSLNEIKELLSGLGLFFGMRFDSQGRLTAPAGPVATPQRTEEGEAEVAVEPEAEPDSEGVEE